MPVAAEGHRPSAITRRRLEDLLLSATLPAPYPDLSATEECLRPLIDLSTDLELDPDPEDLHSTDPASDPSVAEDPLMDLVDPVVRLPSMDLAEDAHSMAQVLEDPSLVELGVPCLSTDLEDLMDPSAAHLMMALCNPSEMVVSEVAAARA